MQSTLSLDLHSQMSAFPNAQRTELEKRGLNIQTDIPVVDAVTMSESVAVSFGDGTVRFFRPGLAYTTVEAHKGVILSMVADTGGVLTGGDDGRFLRVTQDGATEEIYKFDSKWVDCVASSKNYSACSSGNSAYVWDELHSRPTRLEHPSTIGGLAFDAKGRRLAVAHYGGATIWEKHKNRWKSSRLVWNGSHNQITFSPDGKFIVTAMQENALHGWRVRDKANLAMSGYPAKIKSFDWVEGTPFLVTSGAHEAVCWPFDGKFGPMERKPVCVANNNNELVTCVTALPGDDALFAGFRDGSVLAAEVSESKGVIPIRKATGSEITAMAVSACNTHIFIGDAKGNILWTRLVG